MQKIGVDDVDNSVQPAAVMRPLTDAIGATDVAINYYELEPGDSFAFAYHSHSVQEELFYVQAGTATFETEDGDVSVEAGELIRFGPGEFQRGWNRGDEPVVALAIGAPLEYGDVPKLRHCPECDDETTVSLERETATDDVDEDVIVANCTVCGAETGRWKRGSMPGTVP